MPEKTKHSKNTVSTILAIHVIWNSVLNEILRMQNNTASLESSAPVKLSVPYTTFFLKDRKKPYNSQRIISQFSKIKHIH